MLRYTVSSYSSSFSKVSTTCFYDLKHSATQLQIDHSKGKMLTCGTDNMVKVKKRIPSSKGIDLFEITVLTLFKFLRFLDFFLLTIIMFAFQRSDFQSSLFFSFHRFGM